MRGNTKLSMFFFFLEVPKLLWAQNLAANVTGLQKHKTDLTHGSLVTFDTLQAPGDVLSTNYSILAYIWNNFVHFIDWSFPLYI